MACKLIKYSVSNKKTESYIINCDVRSFCCIDDDIFFIHPNGIGLMHNGEVTLDFHYSLSYVRPPDFTKFNAICYNKFNRSLIIVGDNGSQLHSIDVNLMTFMTLMSDIDSKRFKDKYFSRPNSKVYVTSKKGEIVWSAKDLHRCFHFSSNNAEPLVGCGKSGCSTSTSTSSKICCPTGVVFMENIFCFNDCGNNCIRGVRDNFIFDIVSDCKNLKDIHYVDFRLFFLSGNSVHMLSSEGDSTSFLEVYKSEKEILTFYPMNKSCIFVLEEYDNGIPKKSKGN